MKYFSNKKGFTLIELLVVIAIIAILTAIITANFTQSKAKSRDAKRVSDLAQIQLALEMAFDRCNIYPAALDTTTAIATGVCKKLSDGTDYNLGDFISKIPTDFDNASYAYNTLSSGKDYLLGVLLETSSTALKDSASGGTLTFRSVVQTCGTANFYCVQPK